MAITLTGTGGLFVRLGAIFKAIDSVADFLGTGDLSAGGLLSVGVQATNILTEFASNEQFVVDSLFSQRDAVRDAPATYMSYLRGLAETTIIEQAHRDVTLVSKDIDTALREVITQMANGNIYSPANDVDASTVSGSFGSVAGLFGSAGVGTGAGVVSVLRPDGRANEHVYAEVLDLVCDVDGQSGGTARSESFTVKGEPAKDALAFDWPGGSGSSTTLTVVDADIDAGTNLLTNGNFEDQTSNLPDNWALLVGTAGTTLLTETTTVNRTGKSVEFVGDGGGTLTSIAQTFDSATGTTAELKPNTVYQWCIFIRKSAGLAAGSMNIRLLDSSNTVISDDAATANSATLAHGSITTSFAAWTGTFVTPKDLPTTVKVGIRVSVALTSGESVFVDDFTFTEATQLYTGGPYVSLHAGATDFIAGDKFALTVANNYAGEFQQFFQRCFDMLSLGLQLPSDTGGTETIADSLIA